jgi:hypothetical protein
MIAINDAVPPRRNLRQQDGAEKIRRTNHLLVELRAVAKVRDFRDLHPLTGEAFRMLLDKRQKSGDVELKDAVWINLLSRFDRARLKPLVPSQSDREALRLPRHDDHPP